MLGAIQVLRKPCRGRVFFVQKLTLAYGGEGGGQLKAYMLTLHVWGGGEVASQK